MKTLLIIFLLILSSVFCSSQVSIGLPEVVNYSKEAYNAGTRNGNIVQDKNGIVYFANNEGLLSFDGTYWKTYQLANKTMVRSVALDKDNRIYAGGQNEMGYFSPDKNGVLKFQSLVNLLPESKSSFKDIWNIVSYGNDVYFRAQNSIFRYNHTSITIYPAPSKWQYLAVNNNKLIAHDEQKGLLQLIGNTWQPIAEKSDLPAGSAVSSLVSLNKDSTLITTLKNGLFVLSGNTISKFKFPGINPFENEMVMSAIPVNKEVIAVGTLLNGCYIINKKGEILENFSKKDGLQNNTIISLFEDKNLNLWLGLDNGIDLILSNSPIKRIIPDRQNISAGYSSIVFDNHLYFGTAYGLYSSALPKADAGYLQENFTLVPDTKGSVWGMFPMFGNLLLAHHEGALQIKDNKVLPITANTGYWNFFAVKTSASAPLIAAGSYNGLNLMSFTGKEFIYNKSLPNFTESVRFAAIDSNNCVWVAQTYKGVYKIKMSEGGDEKVTLYNDKNGLPSNYNNHLFKIKNRIIVTTEKGVYEYNSRLDKFEPSPALKDLFAQKDIRYLKEDSTGNIWFIEGKKLGVANFSDKKPSLTYIPEMYGKMVTGFENIYAYNKSNVLVGSDKGFYIVDYNQYKKTTTNISVKIRQVKALGKSDSVLYGGYLTDVNQSSAQAAHVFPQIKYAQNSLHFEYSSPLYQYQSTVKYSYRLSGFDNDWSAWSSKAEKDYTNLPAGDYEFEVRAKTNMGNISQASTYSFSVSPPWYSSIAAYFMYVLAGIAVIFLFYKRHQKMLIVQQLKHEEEQQRQQYLHQLELDKAEKEIIALKNEKLQAEIKNKNSELASASMHLLQRGEVLGKIKEEVMHIKKAANTENLSEDLKKVIRTLRQEDNTHKDWEHFAVHFDNVHSDFLRVLKERFPKLTPHELKLCAYLRMNLSSKEMAQLMNISVRGVELSRYRLRKKLQIPTETNLYTFLLESDFSGKQNQFPEPHGLN